jgi:hypothetical protein
MSPLRDALARTDLFATDKLLLVIAEHEAPVSTEAIRAVAKAHGWRKGLQINVGAHLLNTDLAVRLPEGWVLTENGRKRLEEKGVASLAEPLSPLASTLAKHAAKIKNPQRAQFLAEAVGCVRSKHFRAAIVLSWIGAVSLIYEHVIANYLNAFNAEAIRRGKLKSAAKTPDDLATMKEGEFLDICETISVITKATKKELKTCLDRRNTAGHPNSHVFREPAVASHLDTLIAEVFQKL